MDKSLNTIEESDTSQYFKGGSVNEFGWLMILFRVKSLKVKIN